MTLLFSVKFVIKIWSTYSFITKIKNCTLRIFFFFKSCLSDNRRNKNKNETIQWRITSCFPYLRCNVNKHLRSEVTSAGRVIEKIIWPIVWKCWHFFGNKAKGRILKRVFQENKARQIFRKRTFLTPWYAHVRVYVSMGKKCLFFGKFGVLCFLETPVLRFALLAYYQLFLILA